jgi:hypothetical protein
MKVQSLSRFLRVPKEHLGHAVLLDMNADTLKSLKEMIEGHEKELYKITFEPSSLRSLPQNAMFHGMLSEYAKVAGLSLSEAKAQVKHDYGVIIPYEVIKASHAPPLLKEGCFVEIYGDIEFQISTKEYSKPEFARLIDGLTLLCGEMGVSI